MQPTAEGHVILGVMENEQSRQCFLEKILANGTTAWRKWYEDAYTEPIDFLQTSDGGFVVLLWNGASPSIFKTDADGDFVWSQNLASTTILEPVGVKQTANGGYIIIGNGELETGNVITIAWLDPTGDILGSDVLPVQPNWKSETACHLIQRQNGSFLVAGFLKRPNSISTQSFLMQLGEDGTIAWKRAYPLDDEKTDLPVSVVELENQCLMMADRIFNQFGFVLRLRKTDPAGGLLWQWTYYADTAVDVKGMTATRDGGVVVLEDELVDEYGNRLVKFDTHGNPLWGKRIGNTNNAFVSINALEQAGDDTFYAAGSRSISTNDTDTGAYFFHLDQEGNPYE